MLGFTLKNCFTNKQQCLKTSIFCITNMKGIMVTRHQTSTKNIINPKAELLVKLLNVSEDKAMYFLTNPKTDRRPIEKITKTYEICLKYGFGDVFDIARLLPITASILERRINYFQEFGFTKLPLCIILTSTGGAKYTIQEFQAKNLLPAGVDVVAKNIFNILNNPPPDFPCSDLLEKSKSLYEYRSVSMKHYLKWRLKYTEKESSKLIKDNKLVRYLPIKSVEQTIDFLEYELVVPNTLIKSNCHLLFREAVSLRQLLIAYRKLFGNDLNAIVRRNPKILLINPNLIPGRLEILKKYGVEESVLKTYPSALLLSKKTLESRLEEIHSIPELRGFLHHTRFLLLIMYTNKVMKRLQLMKAHNVKSISISTLSSSEVFFNKQLRAGLVRAKGTDCVQFLSKKIGISEAIVHQYLQRNQMWLHAPFIDVVNMYYFLRGRNYTNEDILNNIQILLYKSFRVGELLEKIDSDESEKSNNWTPSQKLALCVYYIEKKYHFSGGGVLEDIPDQRLLTSNPITPDEVLRETEFEQHKRHKKKPL
ncbi:uncharacterized protein LOC124405159 [Diprion similis]|uniref:uncharacterized protein LOC124405159 n=1 Tax=Diprion similis TaxID=362088 RepID=UPI001EF7EEF1|nr:uncharacterized protein LOC124405159 [Diprion similis]